MGSLFFPAVATILKQQIFERAKAKLGGKQLDIFVVNSFSSLAQAGFVFLLLPVLSSLRGIPLSGLPDYLMQGEDHAVGVVPGQRACPFLGVSPENDNDGASLHCPCQLITLSTEGTTTLMPGINVACDLSDVSVHPGLCLPSQVGHA